MKKLSWQQWTGIGIIAVAIISVLVLHFIQPQVSFAFTEIMALVSFVIGVITGLLFNKKKVIQEKQLLLD